MATIEENLELIAENSQTIASDLSEIKTNLGLSSSSSLEDIVDKSERVVEPTGIINITENGTVDVSDYASANVNVPSSGGTYQTKTITPTTSSQTITPDTGYDALSQVNVNAVTSSIDNNIQASNIKKDVTILNVTGTYEGSGGGGEENAIIDGSLSPTRTSVSEDKILYTLLTKVPMIDTSRWTSGAYLFHSCKNLAVIPNINTSEMTTMAYFLNGCSELESIPLLNTSKCANMNYFVRNCLKLKTFPQLDTSKVTSVSYMFAGDTSLEEIPLLDFSSVTSGVPTMISSGMNALTTLGGFKDYGEAFTTSAAENYSSYDLILSYANNLTHDSLMNVINNLYDIKTKGCHNQRLSLGSTHLAKLTAAEIAIATNKGWNVN